MNKYKGIIKDPHMLHKESRPIDLTNETYCSEVETALLNKFNSLNKALLGLSAVQIGIYDRVALVNFRKAKHPFVMFNPEIVWSVGKRKSYERCASENDKVYCVDRPRLLCVKFYSDGKYHTKVYGYWKAKVIQHEIDHMDGVLLKDRGSERK